MKSMLMEVSPANSRDCGHVRVQELPSAWGTSRDGNMEVWHGQGLPALLPHFHDQGQRYAGLSSCTSACLGLCNKHCLKREDNPAAGEFDRKMTRLKAWDFDAILPCHGDYVPVDGKAVLRRHLGL